MTDDKTDASPDSEDDVATVTYLPWVSKSGRDVSRHPSYGSGSSAESAPRPVRAGRAEPSGADGWYRSDEVGETSDSSDSEDGRAVVAVADALADILRLDEARDGGSPAAANVTFDDDEEPEVAPDEIERIADRLVRRLGRKGLSIVEARESLLADGVPEVESEEIIERFERFGYLDDDRLAEQLVTALRDRKKLGRSALNGELRARKLGAESISRALAEVDGDDELATAMDAARSRVRQLATLDHDTAVRRLTGYLMRRGYGSGTVQNVIRELLPGGRSSSSGGFGRGGRGGAQRPGRSNPSGSGGGVRFE